MGQKYTLFLASREGRENDLSWVLFKKKINPNLRDKESGQLPLHQACDHGHTACAELLLKAGARVNCRTADGMTPLHLATYAGHLDCVKLLLRYKADPNAKTRFGSTALHQAAFFGRYECASYLLQYGAKVDVQESWGLTPLMLACQKDDREMAKLLISHQAALSVGEILDGKSALHFACENDSSGCVMAMLDAGIDPNTADGRERTALHSAIANNHSERISCILVEYGADPSLEDDNGTTVLDLLDSDDVRRRLSSTRRNMIKIKAERYTDGPRSLSSLSRNCIRRAMGPSRTDQACDLPLPTRLQQYVSEIR